MSNHSKPYYNIKLSKEHKNQQRKPLMIGCSGGGGHISAILGIEQSLKQTYDSDKLELPLYTPVLAEHKPPAASIHTGANIMHAYGVGKPLQKIIELTPIPLLPHTNALDEEIRSLNKKSKPMVYVAILTCYLMFILKVMKVRRSGIYYNVMKKPAP